MEIPKEKILDLLRSRGDDDRAQQADQELPERVDTDQHRDSLDRLGINPEDLAGNAGGLGDKLGL
jgi:hypothetical protein